MGGGIGMGNTCKPMAVSFQCMTKSTTNKKKKKERKKNKGSQQEKFASALEEVLKFHLQSFLWWQMGFK